MKESNRLRELRLNSLDKKKMSGVEVAKALGISPPFLYNLEKGNKRLSADLASKAADFFGVTVDYLLEKTDQLNENTKNPDSHEESELSEIPIEKLKAFNLSYKGNKLTEEQAEYVIGILEASLKRFD